ncbi:DUF6256 family protein [Streptomyces sp. V1I1]|uniref:DUF6256 family protein n=1 Tax=Streptomyces sp. V1I1 TaxID=3042272 RepID=UPI0027819227|nr:DUF6256 family protein [Streptomyces sp. V1I1]MDQ0945879.1 hypothetical protein [Streptomyces sp. V1I1]
MLPVSLNITLMLTGYLLVMGFLGLGLLIMRRHPTRPWPLARRLAAEPAGRGWPALVRQVAGTALGGYMMLVAVAVGYYHGVAHLGGRFLSSAVTGPALLVGITLPAFFLTSWVATRRRR